MYGRRFSPRTLNRMSGPWMISAGATRVRVGIGDRNST